MEYDFEKELYRKTMHLAVGAIIASLIYFDIAKWHYFFMLLILFLIPLLYINLTKRKVLLISALINRVGRENEYPGFGALTFMTGAIITSFFFTKEIAAASILILAIGDAISPIIGRSFGRTKTKLSKTKLLEGFIAGVFFSFLAVIPIVGWKLALIGSSVSLLLEFWDKTNFIDDNILIPVVAGIVMTLITIF